MSDRAVKKVLPPIPAIGVIGHRGIQTDMKMIDDEFAVCWECGTVFELEGDVGVGRQRIKIGRKRFEYREDMFCPLCRQGRVFRDTLRQMEERFQQQRSKCRSMAQQYEDWKYRAGELQRKNAALQTQIEELKEGI